LGHPFEEIVVLVETTKEMEKIKKKNTVKNGHVELKEMTV
jgi:hypothetical protein